MLSQEKLNRAVKRLPLIPMTGVTFRVVENKHMVKDPQNCLSSIGSLIVGGRYNIINEFSALYTSDNPITALKEVRLVVATRRELLSSKAPPYLLVSIEYRLNRVIDLTDQQNQRALSTNLQELTGVWQPIQALGDIPPTQLLGQSAYQLGKVEALKVPSWVDDGASNLVVFCDRLVSNSCLKVYDDSKNIKAQLPIE